MKWTLTTIALVILVAAIPACSAAAPAPTPTLLVLPTARPTLAATLPPAPPPAGTQAPPPPTATQGAPTFPTPTRMVQQTAVGVDRVQIYLIALNDNGKSGDKIGCGDSVVPVERQISPPTQSPLRTALEELFSIKDRSYGQSGLYNALYQSNLKIDSLSIDANGQATIILSGTYLLAGECDDPRFIAQIASTAKQFPTVKTAVITINGTLLEELFAPK